jgi:phosphopantetheine binding protein
MVDVESTVLEHAQQLLDRDDLTLDDDFFEMGGDSLIGMHFVGRVGRAVDLPVRMTLLFVHPVLRDFATEVEALRQQQIDRAAS